ncbi:DUF805 domain-containing protein [Saccharopolyspora gregorii]|uniref:DUF805 domain-containing protein n=1 Tax=Saccharopolyspora gregorii TaxID=33914 RepID=UPI0021AD3C7F|nr:DUF805 domain-containing protein [Saccharopolyspora gregorii]
MLADDPGDVEPAPRPPQPRGTFAAVAYGGLIPFVAVGIRRLHDTGRSGRRCLPACACLIVLISWAEPSRPHVDQYGP